MKTSGDCSIAPASVVVKITTLKIEKVSSQHIDYDFVQSENQKSVERLVKMFNNGYKTIVIDCGRRLCTQ